MGVLGLWDVLESVGHPIKVEGLEGKILGVDANIWLYKFIRGFREKDNAISIDSHKLGLFNRVCKLLFYRIKPVFVFDGPAPVLKRRTLERRQNTRNKQLTRAQDAALKILANQLKSHYPNADIDHLKITLPNLQSNNLVAAEKLTDEDRDLFYLPDTGKLKNSDDEDSDSDSVYDDNVQFASAKVNIHSRDFEELPAETRYEILQDIKASHRKIRNHNSLPEDANSFSNLQLQRLQSRRKIQEKIEKAEKDICTNYTGELADGSSIQAFRVQSDATARILYRNNTYDPKALDQLKKEDQKPSRSHSPPIKREQLQKNFVDTVPVLETSSGSSTDIEELEIVPPLSRLNNRKLESTILISSDQSSSDDDDHTDDEDFLELQNEYSHLTNDRQALGESPAEVSLMGQSERNLKPSPKPAKSAQFRELQSDSPTGSRSATPSPLPATASQPTAAVRGQSEHTPGTHVHLVTQRSQSIEPDAQQPETASTDRANDETERHVRCDNGSEASIPTQTKLGASQQKRSPNVDPSRSMFATVQRSSPPKQDSQPRELLSQETFEVNPNETWEQYENPAASLDPFAPTNLNSKPQQQASSQNPSASGQDDHRQHHTASSAPSSQQNYSAPSSQQELNALRATNRVTNKVIQDAKELLRLFGIPYLDAAGEAEAQCAKLEELKLTEGTITDDSDIWLFGSQNVFRYFFSDDKYVMQYKMTDIEFHVRLSRDNLACFAMLVGSDYTDGIMNVGPVTALEILSEFPGEGMEPLVKFRDWHREALKNPKAIRADKKRRKLLKFRLPDEFPSRAVFEGYMRPVADSSAEKFAWGTPELDELREYAHRNFGWDYKKADEKLLPVLKRLNERKLQRTIDTFFFKTQANRDPEMFRSKRVNQALNKIAKRRAGKAAAAPAAPMPEVVNLSDDNDDTE